MLSCIIFTCVCVQITVQEGEIQRLLGKLDYVMATPPSREAKVNGESAKVHCEKVHAHSLTRSLTHTHKHTHSHTPHQLQKDLEKANDQISSLNEQLEVDRKERTQAYDERDEVIQKCFAETTKRKASEKEVYTYTSLPFSSESSCSC